MSSLVLELQADALNASISVLDLLRKALVVARKLNIAEFQQWIELELNGYSDQDIPKYRSITGQLRGWNPYHGWQPILTDDENLLTIYTAVCNCSIRQAISELVALVDSGEDELQMQFPPSIESFLISSIGSAVKVSISKASIKKIVESARDIILNWSLSLEEDGIIGQGMTFSVKEKQLAANHDYTGLLQIFNIGQSQVQNSSSETQSNSNTFNNDLHGANIANFANQVQDDATQSASNFSQNIAQNINDVNRLITSLFEMAQAFPEDQREEAMVHLEDLKEDIATPAKQKPQRIKTRICALFAIASTLTGHIPVAADFSNNILELSEKLGIPIEINLPQSIQHLKEHTGHSPFSNKPSQ